MALTVVRDTAADTAVLKSHLADLRYRHETGGMDFNGVRIDTNRELAGMIAGRLRSTSGFPFEFKTADGSFMSVDMVTLEAVSDAFIAHAQGAFAAEKAIADQIDAGTVVDVAGVDAAWLAEISS